MKIYAKALKKIIKEEVEAFKSDYEREQYLRNQQQEAEERRKKKKELRPDYDLIKLSKGILSENELNVEEDDDGYVKVKASALNRLLVENKGDVDKVCNNSGYYKLDEILDFIRRMNQAQKGKA